MTVLDSMRDALEAIGDARPFRFQLHGDQWAELVNLFTHELEWRGGEAHPRYKGVPVHRMPGSAHILVIAED